MTTGADLRAMREAAGFSLSRMAQLTYFSKPLLSLVENGKRAILPNMIIAYEQVLGTPISPPLSDPVRVAHEWLVSNSPMAVQMRAGRQVGSSLADELEARVVELRHLDDTVSSDELGPVIAKELGE